ncbi:TPA: dihydroneopterin aldolase [Candidatus Poribacteria bacterium]|nr:dihydroneopterin aldolase [Candidatus Poribacteria bacterium]
MDNEKLDKIHIRDLLVRCVIGVYDHERENKQDVLINITLYADLRKACQTDNIEDTIDYKVIKKKIVNFVESSSFNLVERLAEKVAEICLENRNVRKVSVTIDKTGALRFAKSVAIEIEREQKY